MHVQAGTGSHGIKADDDMVVGLVMNLTQGSKKHHGIKLSLVGILKTFDNHVRLDTGAFLVNVGNASADYSTNSTKGSTRASTSGRTFKTSGKTTKETTNSRTLKGGISGGIGIAK